MEVRGPSADAAIRTRSKRLCAEAAPRERVPSSSSLPVSEWSEVQPIFDDLQYLVRSSVKKDTQAYLPDRAARIDSRLIQFANPSFKQSSVRSLA